ncbi:hypothetical protein SNE40_020526 [Patella caerulea]|uniref:MD-2-related lipid-recognition domain-containing protein n=1 Tax=Patella caerulea TaxID=87958 RepID=A0AAN8G7K3_PATCE
MIQYLWVAFGLIILSVEARQEFGLTDCPSTNANSSVTFHNFTISPDPVEIPGNLSVSGIVTFNTDIIGNLSLELAITRSLGFFDLPLPCIDHLGSCKYIDVCSILDQGKNATLTCADQLRDNGFPCACPFLNGTYVVDNAVFELPKIKGALASFAKGDYTIKLKLVDLDTDDILGCEDLQFTLTEPPVEYIPTTKAPCGFFCQLIG